MESVERNGAAFYLPNVTLHENIFCSQLQRPAAPCGSTVPSKLKTQGPTASQSHQGAVGFETADLYQVQHLDLASHVTHVTHTRNLLPSGVPTCSCTKLFCLFPGSKHQAWAPECLRNKNCKLCWPTVLVAHGIRCHEIALHYGFAITQACPGTGISIARAGPGTNK